MSRNAFLKCCLATLLLMLSRQAGAQVSVLDSLNRLYYKAVPAGKAIIVDQGGSKALFRADGTPMTPFSYQELWPGLDGDFVAVTGGSYLLLDGSGHLRATFGGPVRMVDTLLRRYVYHEGTTLTRYDADGRELEQTYVEERDYKTGLYRWNTNHPLYGVRDTFGHDILLPEAVRNISVGTTGIVVVKKDSAYVYDRRGKLRFRARADEGLALAHGVAAIKLYGLWALRDSTGKPLTPFKYGQIREQESDRFIQADNSLLDFSGREVVTGGFNYVSPLPGGWVELDGEIRDEGLRLVFKSTDFERSEAVGTRFLHLYKDYNDRTPQVYDRTTRQFRDDGVEEALTDDAYVVYIPATRERKILQGAGLLKLPHFTEVHAIEHYPFFLLTDEGVAARKYLADRRREEFDWGAVLVRRPVNRTGLLDARMRLIVPMGANDIQVLSYDLIYAYRPADSTGYVYDEDGTVLQKFRGGASAHRYGPVVTLEHRTGVTLMDTTGHVFYRGREHPALLYPEARSDGQQRLPALLLYDDSSGYSGLYDLEGRQLLPHQYYAVTQRVTGLFSLKRGDSVYFANTKGRLLFGGRGFAGRKYYLLEGYAVLLQEGQRKWGIMGADGRPLLPFVYDSVSLLRWPDGTVQYLVMQDTGAALVDNAGRLLYPLQPWKPLRRLADDYYLGSDSVHYGIRDGQVLQVAPESYWRTARSRRPFSYWEDFREIGMGDVLPPGIYNRSMKRIAPWYPGFPYRQFRNKIVITDSAKQHIAVLDTQGQVLVPFLPMPGALLANDSTVTALYRDGADLLFHLEGGTYVRREVQVDSSTRRQHLGQGSSLNTNNSPPFTFTASRGVKGISSYRGELLLDNRMDEIITDGYAWRIRRGKRWGLLSHDPLRYIRPPDADSITADRERHRFTIFRNGLQGLYDGNSRTYMPPVYERLYNPASLQNGFIIAKAPQGFTVLDRQGQVVAPYLDSISVTAFSLQHAMAFAEGEAVSLAVADDGRILVQRGTEARVLRTGISGYPYAAVIVREGDKFGLYSNKEFLMVLPAHYDAIESVDGKGFVAWRYYEDKHQGMDSTVLTDETGSPICALKGGFNPKEKEGFWYLQGERRSPIYSTAGKLIVPDGYEVSDLIRHRIFIVSRGGQWGIVNDTGRWTVPLSLDGIEDEEDASGFLIGKADGGSAPRYALISPSGFLLTRPVYDDIRLTESGVLFKRGRLFGYLDAKGKETVRKWPEEELEDYR